MSAAAALVDAARRLGRDAGACRFGTPVTHVYNPLDYAWEPHRRYIERYAGPARTLLLGMNPGPWGMAQTGVPFGDVDSVRGWLGIEGRVRHPRHEHPRRPIAGFDCPRREVSGRRLWGWARARFGAPDVFFARFFVWNYCPLCFLENSGRNRTPDKLRAGERAEVYALCDTALGAVVDALGATRVVGIGRFAAARAEAALAERAIDIRYVTHPSPANPHANRGWEAQIDALVDGLEDR